MVINICFNYKIFTVIYVRINLFILLLINYNLILNKLFINNYNNCNCIKKFYSLNIILINYI